MERVFVVVVRCVIGVLIQVILVGCTDTIAPALAELEERCTDQSIESCTKIVFLVVENTRSTMA